jgi:hypothetical protein
VLELTAFRRASRLGHDAGGGLIEGMESGSLPRQSQRKDPLAWWQGRLSDEAGRAHLRLE